MATKQPTPAQLTHVNTTYAVPGIANLIRKLQPADPPLLVADARNNEMLDRLKELFSLPRPPEGLAEIHAYAVRTAPFEPLNIRLADFTHTIPSGGALVLQGQEHGISVLSLSHTLLGDPAQARKQVLDFLGQQPALEAPDHHTSGAIHRGSVAAHRLGSTLGNRRGRTQ